MQVQCYIIYSRAQKGTKISNWTQILLSEAGVRFLFSFHGDQDLEDQTASSTIPEISQSWVKYEIKKLDNRMRRLFNGRVGERKS